MRLVSRISEKTMKRLIKFRAWDSYRKKMFHDFDQNIKEVGLGRSIHQFVYETGLLYDTLMQYIGAQDKNGCEIFEGDIVKYSFEIDSGGIETLHLNCIYDHSNAWFTFQEKGDEYYEGYYWEEIKGQCEIIGNIYETPELLENPKSPMV